MSPQGVPEYDRRVRDNVGDRLQVGLRALFTLTPRDADQPDRNSTTLELMFDLATVVAVAAAGLGLAQDIERSQFIPGIIKFVCAFFMTWLAWANYTWFASGYDSGSPAFRAMSVVIMFGSLTLAAGIQNVHGDQPIWLILVGFTIMRVGLIALWLGVAAGNRDIRPTALRYASGIGAMQVYWYVLIVAVPPQATAYLPLFALGAFGELAIPALARRHRPANWHHGHIVARHNSFNVIVLGECFAAIAAILSHASIPTFANFWLAGLCAVITLCMWKLYFDRHERISSRKPGAVLIWAYGHSMLFAAGAATAAGFLIYLSLTTGRSTISPASAALSIGMPVALYLATLWLVRDRISDGSSRHRLLLMAAALIALTSAASTHPLELCAIILIVTAKLSAPTNSSSLAGTASGSERRANPR